jgi:hypothetical protein
MPPSEPDSQTTETSPTATAPVPRGFRCERPAPATEWIWPCFSYFEVTTVDHEWIMKRSGKRKLVDGDVRCIHVDDNTKDLATQTATANMRSHLAKHGIIPPSTTESLAPSQKQPSAGWGWPNL